MAKIIGLLLITYALDGALLQNLDEEQVAGISTYVQQIQQCAGTPGFQLAIVKDGEVTSLQFSCSDGTS